MCLSKLKTINQLTLGKKQNIDLSSYVTLGFSEEELREIRMAFLDNFSASTVSLFANKKYNYQQMKIIRKFLSEYYVDHGNTLILPKHPNSKDSLTLVFFLDFVFSPLHDYKTMRILSESLTSVKIYDLNDHDFTLFYDLIISNVSKNTVFSGNHYKKLLNALYFDFKNKDILFDRNFNEEQVDVLYFAIEEFTNHKVDPSVLTYVASPFYCEDTMDSLVDVLRFYFIEQNIFFSLKPFFDPSIPLFNLDVAIRYVRSVNSKSFDNKKLEAIFNAKTKFLAIEALEC